MLVTRIGRLINLFRSSNKQQVCTGGETIPPNAVPFGDVETGKTDKASGKPVTIRLFVARTDWENNTYAAKASPALNKGGCNFVAHGEGKEMQTSLFDCLTAPDNIQLRIVWKTVKTLEDLDDLQNPVSGGCMDAAGNPLLIARVHHKNGFHGGYVGKPSDPGERRQLLLLIPSSNHYSSSN